jgi:2-dehydropantoate 2-reductase
VTGMGEKVAIVGAGAIGLMLGAAFARIGCSVTVCGGTPILSMRVSEGDVTEVARVRHTSCPAHIAGHRLVVLAVKAQHTDDVAYWLRAAASPETTVVVAQNGIEHAERVAPYAGDSAVVPAAVYMSVERSEPGRAIVRRAAGRDLAIPADPAALAVAGLLRAAGLRVETAADFHTAAWLKLLVNVVAGPITALTGRRMEVFRDPAVARYATLLLREAAEVGRADNATIAEDEPERTVAWLQAAPGGAPTSMLADRLAGRSLEHDALTGAVLRAATRHVIAAPHVEALHALLDGASAAGARRQRGAWSLDGPGQSPRSVRGKRS